MKEGTASKSGKIFLSINSEKIAQHIATAKRRVVYISVGLSESVAKALISASKKIGAENVTLILNTEEATMRLGYGEIGGVRLIKSQKSIRISEEPGIRIGALLCDDEGIIFSPTALCIEEEVKESPNGIKANSEQVQQILAAVLPNEDEQKEQIYPEVGAKELPVEQLKEIEGSIELNPIERFDLTRIVGVFNSKIKYVKVEQEGLDLNTHTVKIPSSLLVGASPDVQATIKTTCQLIPKGSPLVEKCDALKKKIANVRNRYTVSFGKRYGRVLPVSLKEKFEAEMSDIKKEIEEWDDEYTKSLETLSEKSKQIIKDSLMFMMANNPPSEYKEEWLGDQGASDTKETRKIFLEMKLDEAFEKKTGKTKPSLNWVFKDIAADSIEEEEFEKGIEDLKRKFKPLFHGQDIFEFFNAAPPPPEAEDTVD